YPLHTEVRFFNVFRYITFRSALAALTALIMSLIVGPWLIGKLQELQSAQSSREEGPSSHQVKRGPPTMGGLLIVPTIVVPTLLWADIFNPFVWIVCGAALPFGADWDIHRLPKH